MATRWMWACQISLDTKTMKSEDKPQILDYVLNVCYLDGKCILDSEKKNNPVYGEQHIHAELYTRNHETRHDVFSCYML